MRALASIVFRLAIQICAFTIASALLIGERDAGWFGFQIANETLSFFSDSSFIPSKQPCTSREHLQATYPAFHHPLNAKQSVAILALFDSQVGLVQQAGKLISMFGIQLSLVPSDTPTGSWLLLLTRDGCSLFFSLPPSGSIESLSLSLDPSQPSNGLQICINSQPASLLPTSSTYCNLDTLGLNLSSTSSSGASSSEALILGDEGGLSARFDLNQLWVLQSAQPFSSCSELSGLINQKGSNKPYPNSPPTLIPSSLTVSPLSALSSDGCFLSDQISISLAISDPDRDPIRARMTIFGAPPSSCSSPGCGNQIMEGTSSPSSDGTVWLNSSYSYPRAGRYLVRVEAVDGRGGVFTKDIHLMVRKDGDVNRTAPCCRYSGGMVGAQQGRPIHSTMYRHPKLYQYARDLGWGGSDSNLYMNTEDLESERLFDYSILAPAPTSSAFRAIERVTCPDTRIGGSGGVKVQGVGSRELNLGHNKRLLIIPQGYDWALNVTPSDRPWCQSHWSNWASTSPYKTPITTPIAIPSPSSSSSSGDAKLGLTQSYCSYACTKEGVEATIEFTGLFDRWIERIIETSYGQVSFSPLIDIAPTVWLPRNNSHPNVYLYNDAPTQAYLLSQGIQDASLFYRSVFVLAPMPLQLRSPLRETGWSSAPTFGYFMQCNPQSYYLYHEIGHLFGLPHASVYKLTGGATSSSLPVDPIGPGLVEDSYSDPFDSMACCKGDFSVTSRIMAGWIGSSERIEIDLVHSNSNSNIGSSTEFTLWPFDRGESKGKVKSITLRISDDQILVLSYRSNALWQDVRVGVEGATSSQDQTLDPSSMRSNTAGLTIEYMKRVGFDPLTSEPQWSGRGLVDLNLLFPLWPDAFPTSNNSYAPSPSPRAAYAAMKEGFVWTDATRGFQIASIRSSKCPSPSVKNPSPSVKSPSVKSSDDSPDDSSDDSPDDSSDDSPDDSPSVRLPQSLSSDDSPDLNLEPYEYSTLGFYGFRGEYPGTEEFDRSDFSGYASGLTCLTVRVGSGPKVKEPGKLGIRVRVGSMNQVDLRGSASCDLPQVPPTLKIIWPSSSSSYSASSLSTQVYEDPPLSIVWKDALNETFATDSLSVPLPLPLSPLASSSAQGAPECFGSRCPHDKTYWVKASAMSGAHTLVKIQITDLSISTGYTLNTTYYYFGSKGMVVEEETQSVPILLFTPINPYSVPLTPSTNTPTSDGGNGSSTDGGVWSQAMGVQLSLGVGPNLSTTPVMSFTLLGLHSTPPLTPTPLLPPNYSSLDPSSTLPSASCSRQWTFTFKLQLILDPRSNNSNQSKTTSSSSSAGLGGGSRSILSPSLSSMISGLTHNHYPLVTFPTLDGGLSSSSSPSSSTLPSGLYLLPSASPSPVSPLSPSSSPVMSSLIARVIWQGLVSDLDLTPSLSLSYTNSSQPSSARVPFHLTWVRDGSRMGIWSDGIGGWLKGEMACPDGHVNPKPNTLRRKCTAASTSTVSSTIQPFLPPFLLFGPALTSSSSSKASTFLSPSPSFIAASSPRLFNYALPPSDFNNEALCSLTAADGCSSRFNLLITPDQASSSSSSSSLDSSDALFAPFISPDDVRAALGLKTVSPSSPSSYAQGQLGIIDSNVSQQPPEQGKSPLSLAIIAGAGGGGGAVLLALVVLLVVVMRGRRAKVAQISALPTSSHTTLPPHPHPHASSHHSPPPRPTTKKAKTKQEEEEEERIERALATMTSPIRGVGIGGGGHGGGIGRASGVGILSSPVLRSSRKPPTAPPNLPNPSYAPKPIAWANEEPQLQPGGEGGEGQGGKDVATPSRVRVRPRGPAPAAARLPSSASPTRSRNSKEAGDLAYL